MLLLEGQKKKVLENSSTAPDPLPPTHTQVTGSPKMGPATSASGGRSSCLRFSDILTIRKLGPLQAWPAALADPSSGHRASQKRSRGVGSCPEATVPGHYGAKS